MDTGSVVLIIVVAVVLLAGIVFAVRASGAKKKERDRGRAAELREQAAAQATGVQQREAHAEDASRAAERAREEAERLEAEAADRAAAAERERAEHQETMRAADELDPDVPSAAPTTTDTEAETRTGTHRATPAESSRTE
ncbi:hypothetical protein [Nocardioides iriomotensis]|uniref:hypothetical protein n=1 Tax=Nocardioides iriomotensis TaxID=715784 RepID=UPI0013EE3210|nr:hypothetical protein [Nocardioides iriomotensis]